LIDHEKIGGKKMPSYLSPGVYVEEKSSGVKTIAGVGTSVAAFIGFAEKGTDNQPTLITNWTQFVNQFGELNTNYYLGFAVYGFFAEGGTTCYVVKVADAGEDTDYNIGLSSLDTVDIINMVAIPDCAGDRSAVLAGLNYCTNRKDCLFIADPLMNLSPQEVLTYKNPADGTNSFNTSYGALYYPWVYMNSPATGKKILVPPSGVVAGTYAYTDSTRGVHKAPAGTVDGYLDSVTGIELVVTKDEQDLLNPEGINVIRSLPDGICVWGARTLSEDTEWTYVNVRRLLMYIEESIDEGTQWVVFEPNTTALWGSVKRNITSFLTRVWRDGALFGSTAEEAFYVKVDQENNPEDVRDSGQLIIEVGVAPVKPAEFVIIRISQTTL
jgi:uncharacterized protein